MTQRIEVTDLRNNEVMTMTFPLRLVRIVENVLSMFPRVLDNTSFHMRFDPPLHFSREGRIIPEPPVKVPVNPVILAALVAALEEGYI